MKALGKLKNRWLFLLAAGLIALCVVYFPDILKGISSFFSAAFPLIVGAMLAFLFNLIMDPVAAKCRKSSHPFLKKHAQTIGMVSSILITLILFAVILGIVIPNLYEAIKVLSREAPTYIKNFKAWLTTLVDDNPAIKQYVASLDTSWESILKGVTSYFSKGMTGIFDSTLDVVTSITSALYNLIIIVIFALFVLSSKTLFIKTYRLLCRLYLQPKTEAVITRDMRILYSSFRSFVVGSLIQAAILIVVIGAADYLLGIPYALMAAVIVGVINIIPMVGAFIGGGIAAFIIFTASPMKCLIFLLMLVVIQELSSNVLYPRIIGNRIGLPGIYVMITIVIAGALFGVAGMILGVPLVAAVYRMIKIRLEERADRKGVHEDPVVRELHGSNMKLYEFLQEEARESFNKLENGLVEIERKENLEEVRAENPEYFSGESKASK